MGGFKYELRRHSASGQVVKVLDFDVVGHRFDSNSSRDWKTPSVHPALNGYLTYHWGSFKAAKEED